MSNSGAYVRRRKQLSYSFVSALLTVVVLYLDYNERQAISFAGCVIRLNRMELAFIASLPLRCARYVFRLLQFAA